MSPPDRREDPCAVECLAAETAQGSDSRANLPERLERYGRAKERALSMRDFIAGHIPQSKEQQGLLRELQHCGSYLVFRHYFESDRVRLHAMRSCRLHLLCPFCAIRRGAKMLARYLERFNAVRAGHPELRAHMVTLTVKDGPDLQERYAHLHKSVKAFHHRRHLGRGSQAERIAGAVWSYEFKRGSGSGLWHPHVHAVWLCEQGNGPRSASLSREWAEITGDSHIVETHGLYGDPADAFAEVFKYAVKFGGLPLADNWHGYEVLRARRLVASSGVLWGVPMPDDLVDEALNENFVELCYRFLRGNGYVDVGVRSEAAA